MFRPAPTPESAIHLSHHHRIHGLSCEAFERLLARANRQCEICGAEPGVHGSFRPTTTLWIDHCHTTGRVRGMVCPKCNALMRRIDSGERQPTPAVERFLSLTL